MKMKLKYERMKESKELKN